MLPLCLNLINGFELSSVIHTLNDKICSDITPICYIWDRDKKKNINHKITMYINFKMGNSMLSKATYMYISTEVKRKTWL